MEDIIKTVIRMGFVVNLKQKRENKITIRRIKNITNDIKKAMFPDETGYVAVRLLKNARFPNNVKNIAVEKIRFKLDISQVFFTRASFFLSISLLG